MVLSGDAGWSLKAFWEGTNAALNREKQRRKFFQN